MHIDLSHKEIAILIKLIELELEEINPEIRRSATISMRDELRQDREVLRQLLGRMYAASEREKAVGNW